jgi:hypothetical protein
VSDMSTHPQDPPTTAVEDAATEAQMEADRREYAAWMKALRDGHPSQFVENDEPF